MKTFLTMPLKAVMAVAVVALLSGAKEAPASRDAGYQADNCSQAGPAGQAEKANKPDRRKRHKLIRGMI